MMWNEMSKAEEVDLCSHSGDFYIVTAAKKENFTAQEGQELN